MFKMNFILRQKKDGSLYLELPVWFRLMFLFIAVLIAAGVFAADSARGGILIPIILTAACLVGSVYEEKWIFSADNGTIRYLSGLVFLYRKKEFRTADTEALLLSGEPDAEGKGLHQRFRRNMIKFSLQMKSGERHSIDFSTGRTANGDLEKKAQKISSYTGIPLERIV